MAQYNKEMIRYSYALSSSKLFPQRHFGLVVYFLECVHTVLGYCNTKL